MLERRLRVVKEVQSSSLQKFSSWGGYYGLKFSEPTPLFDQQLLEEGEEPEGNKEEDKDMLVRLLGDEPDDEEGITILSAA